MTTTAQRNAKMHAMFEYARLQGARDEAEKAGNADIADGIRREIARHDEENRRRRARNAARRLAYRSRH